MLGKLLSKSNARRTLWICVLLVAALHVAGILVFGSLVIFRHLFDREVAFEAPPEIEKRLEPRKLEHQVKIQEHQQQSGRPRIQPRLSAQKVTQLSLPDITAQPRPVTDFLKTDLQSIDQAGLGVGLGGGRGLGGLGAGVSQVVFMGIRAQTERVAVLLDMSLSMIEDERGAFAGYAALKKEVADVINNLSEGTFFNIIGYGNGVDIFRPQAQLARRAAKQEAIEWLGPYMTNTASVRDNGVLLRNFRLDPDAPVIGDYASGLTRLDLAVAAAFQSGVDTLIIVSDGHHNIYIGFSEEERQQRQEELQKIIDRMSPAERARRDRSYERRVAEREKENMRRRQRGLADKVEEDRTIGRYPSLPNPRFSDAEVLDYINQLAVHYYDQKGVPRPKIHVIAYVPEPGGEGFMKELTRRFQGRYRISRALVRPIRS